MTITEFLLARIAEDEQVANTASGVIAGPAQFGKDLWNFGDQRLEITKDRVLAECEAKRRIVERCEFVPSGASWEHEGLMSDVLGHLASVYADHPDYRDEWRM